MRFLQATSKAQILYAELLWAKALRCNQVYNEYLQKSNFFRGLEECIGKSMRLSWASNNRTKVQPGARGGTTDNLAEWFMFKRRDSKSVKHRNAMRTDKAKQPRLYTTTPMPHYHPLWLASQVPRTIYQCCSKNKQRTSSFQGREARHLAMQVSLLLQTMLKV